MRPASGVARGKGHSSNSVGRGTGRSYDMSNQGFRQNPYYDSNNYASNSEYVDFQTNDSRRNFIYKVYLILTAAIGFCAALIFTTSYFEESREFLNDYWWLYIVFWVVFFIIYLIFSCIRAARKTFPINFILFIIMVISLGAATAVFASRYSLIIIAYAFMTTTGVTILVTIVARFIPIDFTKCAGLFCILSIVFLLISIVMIVLMFVLNMPILHVVLAGIGVVFITFWMLFDTQMILGGKNELEEDEYLLGAIHLFVDVMYIFQYLLILFGFCANDE